jgi:hypothetical protein
MSMFHLNISLIYNVAFFSDEGQMIERASYSGILLPGLEWHTRTHNGPTALHTFLLFVNSDS